jgi:hypothetical protein
MGTSDGRWNYSWDAENRLVALAPTTLVGPQISLKFGFSSTQGVWLVGKSSYRSHIV